jgi:carbonic anhydrase
MRFLQFLFDKNKNWSQKIKASDPEFFEKLSRQQSPEYLWIGCSDSRVPANEIVDLLPGELFVHRNVANVVVHTDLNCLSVIQYAVDVLKVKHVIVCGHYGCGGVRAAFHNERHGLIDNWLRHIQDVYDQHKILVEGKTTIDDRVNKLCEVNVIEQVLHVVQSTIVQDAWLRGQELAVHGWIYGLNDGLLRDLNFSVANGNEVQKYYNSALLALQQTSD